MLLLTLLIASADAHYSVLVYGPTDDVASSSLGSNALVTVWDATQWGAAATSDFAGFDLILIPEGGCSGPTSADLQPLYDTRAVWQPAVTGNVLVSHMAPFCHVSTESAAVDLIEGFLDHSAYFGGPGLWVSGDFGERDLDFLDAWGSFTSSDSGADAVSLTTTTHAMWNGLAATDLQSWGDVASGTIDSYPSDWVVEATNPSGDAVVVTFEGCDQDFDGYLEVSRCGGSDCDDTSFLIWPGATEYCDAIDNDCDGVVDESDSVDATTWYADSDSDGFGDSNVWQSSCDQPSGYTTDLTDCDDTSSLAYPGGVEVCDSLDNDCDGTVDESDASDASDWYADVDGDGYGDPNTVQVACDPPSNYVGDKSDCDDADSGSFPGATEIYYDGVDQDCDGVDACDWDLDGEDSDNCSGGADCDDTDASINTSATDIWYDGVDQDCDAWSDYDQDHDGVDSDVYGGTDCDDTDITVYPGAPEISDGKDNDCNGYSEDDDGDGDGLTSEDELSLGTDPALGDTDGDGLSDGDETPNMSLVDTDNDGTADPFDTDDDDDGILTAVEVLDYDWTDPVDTPPDTDNDGLIDPHDLDSDGDGLLDSVEGEDDSDGDGLSNRIDVDSDNDGIGDAEEVVGDSDSDGTDDVHDVDDDGDGIPTATEGAIDSDGDGTLDYLDLDSDADWIEDNIEGTFDSDNDGTADYLDTDSDADGLTDLEEGFGDSDSDGAEDFRDSDDDDDHLLTILEALGGVAVDSDQDGVPDHLDLDSDNDGFGDEEESDADSDGDGIRDSLDDDSENDSIPDRDELAGDSDADGLSDRLDADDDGDGIRSAFEGAVDSDSDGLADYIDEDSDDDGQSDFDEGLRDRDCDGLRNYVDSDDEDGPCGTKAWSELDTGDTGLEEKQESGGCSSSGQSGGPAWIGFLLLASVLQRRQYRKGKAS